jgi:cbb3-type cytochrome oxidase subunit 3
MYYNDKYFTLNITNILLDGFMLATIVLVIFSIIYGGISVVKQLAKLLHLNLNSSELKEYIIQYCYFINNSSCEGIHNLKMLSIFLIFAILMVIYALRRSGSHSINYADYLNFEKSKDGKNSEPKNIENMLNIICDENNDFLNSNSNITKIMNKLNGHNIHTVSIINDTNVTNDNTVLEAAKKTLDDAKRTSDAVKIADANKALKAAEEVSTNNANINKFITIIKKISAIIKNNNKDDKDNKDLDFVKLVIVYLNNKKIYNDNISSEKIPNFDVGRTYAQSLLNIITYVIPFSNNLFGKFKTTNYDIENILIGAVPLLDRLNISKPEDKCPINEYTSSDEFNKITEQKKCYYNNYIFKLKETRAKLKKGLNDILIAFILSTIAIIVLFYYIYINYNVDNMRWAKMAAIKMQRLPYRNPLNWLSMLIGYIMFWLNNNN